MPLCMAFAVITSCSTDSDENEDGTLDASALVGTWNMTDVRFEEDPSDPSLNLADEIVDELLQEDCILVSFIFNTDGSVTSTDKVNYLQVNAGPNGLDVPCPTQSDNETASWSLEGDQLTLDDGNGTVETITIELEGNTLIIAGEDIDENNYVGAEAIFTKQ